MRGSTHWLFQRITSVILLPLVIWFLYQAIELSNYNYAQTLIFFKSKINSTLFLLMTLTMLYHSKLGMETIFQDYIKSIRLRKFNLLLNFIFFALALASISSIFFIQFFE